MSAMGEQETPRLDTSPPLQSGLEQEHSITLLLLALSTALKDQGCMLNQASSTTGGEFSLYACMQM